MPGPELKELRLEKFLPLVHGAFGAGSVFALCDAAGAALWTSDGDAGGGIASDLEGGGERGVVWGGENEGALCQDLGERGTLLYRRLADRDEEPTWLVVRSDAPPGGDGARLEGVLEGLAAAIADELRLNRELVDVVRELSQRHEELNLAYSIREELPGGGRLEQGLEGLLERVGLFVGVDLAAFVTAGRSPLYAIAPDARVAGLDMIFAHAAGSVLRFIVQADAPLVLNRPDDPRRAFLFPHLPCKFLACPVHDELHGRSMLLLVRDGEGPDFSAGDRNLALVVADHVRGTLRHLASLERMRRFGDQLVSALVQAVEAKDPITAGHSERVQELSIHVGRAIGMQRAELEDLYWASILHDVGKIGIPDAILAKPARLTGDEFAFIRTHPEQSYQILRHIDQLSEHALAGVRHHHERYDGSGYPDGLSGWEIPTHARVIAVADAYDGLTAARAYRSAVAHEVALEEILRVAGSQLDPEIVCAFEHACREDAALRGWIAARRGAAS